MAVLNYQELFAWQQALILVSTCHQQSTNLPKTDTDRLTATLQRTTAMIPSEIVHGQGRSTTREFLWHLGDPKGVRRELVTDLILPNRVGLINQVEPTNVLPRGLEVSKLIHGLINSLECELEL